MDSYCGFCGKFAYTWNEEHLKFDAFALKFSSFA